MVGSVSTLTKGKRALAKRVRAALVLAICRRLSKPSCMRAPPVAVKLMKGTFCSMAVCTPRTKRSPTTEPIEPPMKSNSKHAATQGTLITAPPITTRASVSPVDSSADFKRSGYFLLSRNLSGSTGSTSCPIS